MRPELETHLKELFDEKCALISDWVRQGRLPALDPRHLIFSIWATTQHYADFETQVEVLLGSDADTYGGAAAHLRKMFGALLQNATS